jgi:basic amino acid/polyamine antiporter, APA family
VALTIPNNPTPATELRRQLGLGSAAAAVAGEVIGVGIFLTPAGMAKSLGSPFWLLVVWLLVGAMALSGALCYGELAGRFPRPGGTYVYLQETYGSRVAFVYGWMCLLVLDPGVTAALAVGGGSYAAYIFRWSPSEIKLAAIISILAISVLNIFSTLLGAGVLRWFTWFKLGILALLAVWPIIFKLGSWSNFVPFVAQRHGALPLLPALGGAMVAAMYSFGGWWDVSKIQGEVRNPARTLPRAMVLGVLAVTAVFILISAMFLYVVPLAKVTSGETFVAQAGQAIFGTAGGVVLSAIVVLCVLGSLAAMIMASPRVYFAMARDDVFLRAIAGPHPRYGTPAGAIAILGILASVLVLVGSFEQIIAYFFFVAIVFLGLTVAGLFVIRRRESEHAQLLKTPSYPVTPVVFLVMVVVLLVALAVRYPRESVIGTVVVLAGAPVYDMFVAKNRKEAVAKVEADRKECLQK